MTNLIFSLIFLVWCGVGYAENARLPINEFSTQVITQQGGRYTEIGAGINYQKDDGSFDVASAQFVASKRTGIDWECFTTHNRIGLNNDISSGVYSVFSQIGNTGQILRSKPVAIAYLNTETKEWTIIANLQSSVASVSGNKILYKDAFKNCDLEYVIQKDRLKQNIYIKSIEGFGKSSYDADKTQVVIVTKFDLDNFETPKIVDSRGEISLATMKSASITAKNTGDETIDGELVFTKQRFGMCEATDNKGDTQKIRKRIIKHDGNYYLLEGLPYSWLASASYPVLLDYTTVSSAFGTATWTTGTYYISASTDQNQNSLLTIDAGVIVKLGSGVTLSVNGIDINGTYSSWVYITSKNDNSVGETIDGSSGSPAAGDWATFGLIYWNNQGNSSCAMNNCVFRYGTVGWDGGNGYTGITHNFNDVVFKNFSGTGIRFVTRGNHTLNLYDFQLDTCVTGINTNRDYMTTATLKRGLIRGCSTTGIGGDYAGDIDGYNLTIDGNAIGIRQHYGTTTSTLTNCIISNNTTNLVNDQTLTFNYVLQYNNGTTNNPTANNNPLTSANPNFATGTAVTGYIGDMTYFLNQATSPCINAGSDTAANLGMDSYTTAIDSTLDSSTVDIGYHYEPDDVGTAAGGTTQFPIELIGSYIGVKIGR